MTPTKRDGGFALCGACGATWTWATGENPGHVCPAPQEAFTVTYEPGGFTIGVDPGDGRQAFRFPSPRDSDDPA